MPYRWSLAPSPSPLDLSHAARLKDVEFHLMKPRVQWIVATLLTAKPEHLQQVTILAYLTPDSFMETDRPGWQNLDHLLARLWTSHSVIPRIKCPKTMDVTDLIPSLLPKLVVKGLVCEVGYYSGLI